MSADLGGIETFFRFLAESSGGKPPHSKWLNYTSRLNKLIKMNSHTNGIAATSTYYLGDVILIKNLSINKHRDKQLPDFVWY